MSVWDFVSATRDGDEEGGGCRVETVVFPLEDGGVVLVRVSESEPGGVVSRGGSVTERLERAEQTFEAALGIIRAVAHGVLSQLTELARSPDEVHVEFGLEFTGKAGAVLATAETSTQLRVDLTWRPLRPERETIVGNGGD
jgi:hypothetical protein